MLLCMICMEDDPCPTTSLSNHYQRSIVYCVVVPSLHYVVYRLYINGVVSADPGCARGSVTNVSLWVLLALAIFHLWFYNPWQFLQLWFRPRPETQYTKHLQTATRSPSPRAEAAYWCFLPAVVGTRTPTFWKFYFS